jgi:hypothetical protein
MQEFADDPFKLIKSIQLRWFYLQLLVIHATVLMRLTQDIFTKFP